MAELYNLVVKREIEKTVPCIKKKKGTGMSVESTKTVSAEEVTKLVLLKPNSQQMEDAEFFYGQQFNRYIQAGYLTKAMLQKKFNDVGGLIDGENDGLAKLLAEYMDASKVIEFYEGQEELSEEKQSLLDKAKKTFGIAQEALTTFQSNLSSQFNQTADVKAEQKVLEWVLINSLYLKEAREDGTTELFPFFEGHGYEEKRGFYMSLREDEEEIEDAGLLKKKLVLDKSFDELIRAIAIWHNGAAKTEDEIRAMIKQLFDEPESK